MKFFIFLSSTFLVLQMTNSMPSPVEGIPTISAENENLQGKVRDKRKSDVVVPVNPIIPPPAPLPAPIPSVQLPVEIPQQTVQEVLKATSPEKHTLPVETPTLPDIPVEQDSVAARVKKQAIKVPCTSKTVCGLPTQPEQRQDVVLINQDGLAKPSGDGKHYLKQSRTIDPIYSFGPVSVNSNAGYGHNTGSYGHSYNYAVPAHPISSYSSQSSYSSPGGGLSYQVVMPYAAAPIQHRQPVSQHSLTISHAPIEIKPVMYYQAPEPIVVEAHDDSIHSSHAEHDSYAVHDANPVSLYCQTLKSKDLAKTLTSGVKGKSNESSDDTLEHIQRVNEIKDEIMELNAAAQKIVDQQERLYRMQQDAMIPQRNVEPMMMRSVDPLMMMRTHPRMPPYSPYMYHNSFLRPTMFREAEEVPEPTKVEEPKKEEEKPKPKEEPKEQKPKEESPPKEIQTKNDVSENQKENSGMRQFYPDYPGYYRSDYPGVEHMRHYGLPYGGYFRSGAEGYQPASYRTFPGVYGTEFMPYQRSETGFPTSPLFSMRSQPEAVYRSSDDGQFMKQLIEMGKKMGIVPNDYQPANKEKKDNEGLASKSENVMDDLRFGEKQKPKNSDEPTSIDMTPVKGQQEQTGQKKDKRGLIHKKE